MEFMCDDAEAGVAVWLSAEESAAWMTDPDAKQDLHCLILDEWYSRSLQCSLIVSFADGSAATAASMPDL